MEIVLDNHYCSCIKTVTIRRGFFCFYLFVCLFFKKPLLTAGFARHWVSNVSDPNTGADLASVSAWELGANWSKCYVNPTQVAAIQRDAGILHKRCEDWYFFSLYTCQNWNTKKKNWVGPVWMERLRAEQRSLETPSRALYTSIPVCNSFPSSYWNTF